MGKLMILISSITPWLCDRAWRASTETKVEVIKLPAIMPVKIPMSHQTNEVKGPDCFTSTSTWRKDSHYLLCNTIFEHEEAWSEFSISEHLWGLISISKLMTCLKMKEQKLIWVEDSIQGEKQCADTILEKWFIGASLKNIFLLISTLWASCGLQAQISADAGLQIKQKWVSRNLVFILWWTS